jgi:hypothetical protein
MLLPALSVTLIGIVTALFAIVRGGAAGQLLLRGLLGAWLGFVAGAIPGVLLDVILGDGVYVALIGHGAAVAGAVIAVRRRSVFSSPTPR